MNTPNKRPNINESTKTPTKKKIKTRINMNKKKGSCLQFESHMNNIKLTTLKDNTKEEDNQEKYCINNDNVSYTQNPENTNRTQ